MFITICYRIALMPKRKMKEPEEFHVRLKLTDEMARRFQLVKKKHQFESNTDLVRLLINKEYNSLSAGSLPLEHFNLNEQGVLIRDPALDPPRGRIIQVYFKPDGPECELCESKRCRHIEFALSLPEVQKILREKGWEI